MNSSPSIPTRIGGMSCLYSSALVESCGGIRVSTFTHPVLSV
ncbi:hypothetical protein AtDm6_3036 [Acetobacter tropicalis]|uniref:Uncharacterized protein n=1 Tax=Acetobacter tropicalis TaxID=104102 RepID=A0A094YH89_9PROT|nr:hypothetical protein AtDm6_3036 [Acetobacter tropicalis]